MTKQILAIDDQLANLLIIEEYLSGEDYQITSVLSAEAGLEHLRSGKKVHAILLDRMMPGMDGIEFLKHVKKTDQFKRIPVIMQTASAGEEQVVEGIAADVFYYLTKPFKQTVLLNVLKNALRDYEIYDDLLARLEKSNAALNHLIECHFRFKSLEDLTTIAYYLSNLYPDPAAVIMGIREIMINAVEHGNLGISYADKTALISNGTWEEEIKNRLQHPEYGDKYAVAEFKRLPHEIILKITDQGGGFDWQKYLEMTPTRSLDNHGRGIAMAKILSFDEMSYEGLGNIVICKTKL